MSTANIINHKKIRFILSPQDLYKYQREAPFWIAFLFWSLMPETETPWMWVFDIRIESKFVLLAFVAMWYFLIMPYISWNRMVASSKSAAQLFLFTLAIFAYSALSMMWSGMTGRYPAAMTYTLCIAVSAPVLTYGLLVARPLKSVKQFLWHLTVAIAFLSLIYSAESIFSLGLRSVQSNADFGMDRVKGPLFGAATGQFIIIPALGYALQELLNDRRNIMLKIVVIFSLIVTIFGLGSRTALVTLAAFILLILCFLKNRKQKIVLVMVFIVLTGGAIAVIFSKADSKRVLTLESVQRGMTYLSSANIIANRSLTINILGSGYGSIWPWYIIDSEQGGNDPITGDTAMIWSPGGMVNYHPHSNLLFFAVELGIPGILYYLYLMIFLIKHVFLSIKKSQQPLLFCGIFASTISMFTDLCLFKGWSVAVVWWAFLFGALFLEENISLTGAVHQQSQK